MNKPVDFTNDLGGHVILWAKGWYHKGFYHKNQSLASDYERLYEVIRAVTGMPDSYTPNAKSLLSLFTEIATKIGIKHEHIAESILRSANRYTTYHVQDSDEIKIRDVMDAYVSNIAASRCSVEGKLKISLPSLNEKIRQKYDLEKFAYSFIQEKK